MPASTRSTSLGRALLVALVVVVLDRITKIWVVEFLELRTRLAIPVWEPWLAFRMAWNRGVNFGLLDFGDSGRWALVALAAAISLGLALWVRQRRGRGPVIGTGLVIGGAIGNVWDRMTYGAVADFLNMSCCGIDNPFAFNIADAAIFGGVAVLLAFPGIEAAPAGETAPARPGPRDDGA